MDISFKQFMLKEQTGDIDLTTQFFFISRNAATNAHYLHLMTDSFAQHSALNEFYDGIIEKIDSYIEAYIGKFGKINNVIPNDTPFYSVHEYRNWLEDNRKKLTDASDLQNIIDEILAFTDSIIYKLDNLK